MTEPTNVEEARNLTKERDADVIPVARELFRFLASHEDLMMGSRESTNAEKAAEYFQKIYIEGVIPLFKQHNLRLDAISYVFQLMMQPIQLLNDVTTSSFEMNRDLADAKKYKIADIAELRVNDLDAALKE